MADIKVYKNEDYTATMIKHDDGKADYFIKYHSSTNPQEIQVTEREYLLYADDFRKPAERHRNGKRRHIQGDELEAIDESKMLLTHTTDFSIRFDIRVSVEMVIKTCTPTQQERFSLYHYYGFTFEEIAKLKGVSYQAVQQSINFVSEKIKNIFLSHL